MSLVRAQPQQGNWVVSGEQVVQNESISLDGNLTVESGGNLTLRNVNLAVDGKSNGQFGVLVQSGGSLYVYNSTIRPASGSARYTFVAQGKGFVMEDTTVQGAGWCTSGAWKQCSPAYNPTTPSAGVTVETGGALIEGNSFSGGGIGLFVVASNAKIQGNKFESNDVASLGVDGKGEQVVNNTLAQSPNNEAAAILMQNANESLVSGNTVTCGAWSAGLPSSGRCDGILLSQSYNDSITDNVIQAANIAVFLSVAGGTSIVGNLLDGAENGINTFLNAVDSKIENNEITSLTTAGITLEYGDDSIVANNTITGSPLIGVQLDHTNGAVVVNNVVRMQTLGDNNGIPGIYLSSSSHDKLVGNTISDAQVGVLLYSSSDTNTIYDNDVGGASSISIYNSSSNAIYGNNFHDFPGQFGGPNDYGRNLWANGTVGNYWTYYSSSKSCSPPLPASCFAGNDPYSRNIVPPFGNENSSASSPFVISAKPIPTVGFVAFPLSANQGMLYQTLISNEVLKVGYGTIMPKAGSTSLTIENSTMFLGASGPVTIGGGAVGNLTIVNSRLIDSGFGFVPSPKNFGSLTIVNSTLDGGYLQDFVVQNMTVRDSVVENSQQGYGITLGQASNVDITGNSFSNDLFAIRGGSYQFAAGTVIIENNKIGDSINTGILWYGNASKLVVSGNDLSGGWSAGISLNTGGAVVANNTLSGFESTAISVYGNGNDYTIENNSISSSKVGIEMGGTSGDLVTGNVIRGSSSGIGMQGNNNILQGNTVNGTNVFDTPVGGSGDVIYHNDFVSNNPSYASTTTNLWSYKGEGNYWSGYTGKDPDLDGIGDTPYNLGSASDAYPFMNENGWLTRFFVSLNTNLPGGSSFVVNGTKFSVGQGGTASLRLGYAAAYNFTLPETLKLATGSALSFSDWGDGVRSASRTLKLSANTTLGATYTLSTVTTSSVPEFPAQSLIVTTAVSVALASWLMTRNRTRASQH